MKQINTLIFLFLSVLLMGQKINISPVNPELKAYYNNLNSSKSPVNYGYIPNAIKPYFTEKKEKSNKIFPETYDLRKLGWITYPKDQKGCGSCWNFSTMAAIESNWLMNGYGEYDLSEQNLRTCQMYRDASEGTCIGGNETIASSYYFSGLGPVNESDDPYIPSPWSTCKENQSLVAYVPEAYYLPNDRDIVKQAIMDYGAIYASMLMVDGDPNFFSTDSTYYYSQGGEVNHAIVIIGWDDNMQIWGKTGAWIVKNSWGQDWGANGYFYISYKDTKILSSSAVFPTKLEAEKFQTIYQYDSLGWLSNTGFGKETAYGLVKFTAKAKQKIANIGTYVSASNTIVDIKIYLGKKGQELYGFVTELQDLTCEFPGHYIFTLNDTLKVTEGIDFYVLVKYTTPGYNFPIPNEKYIFQDGNVYADPRIENNVCWISSDGLYWIPLGSNQAEDISKLDLTIKAYGIADTLETSNANSFKISPNPANGFISIETENINPGEVIIEIANLRGDLLLKKTWTTTVSAFYTQLNVSELANGIYAVRITSPNKTEKHKIVIVN